MVTKLKSFSYSFILKGLAFLLVVICMGIALSLFISMAVLSISPDFIVTEQLTEKDYLQSDNFLNYRSELYYDLTSLLSDKNEEHIKNEITEQFTKFNTEEQLEEIDIQQELEPQINDRITNFRDLKQRLNKLSGIYYYATDGENTFTNCKETEKNYFKNFKVHVLNDKDTFEYNSKDKNNDLLIDRPYYSEHSLESNPKYTIYIAFSDELIAKEHTEWSKLYRHSKNVLIGIIVAVIISVIALIYLMFTTGRNSVDRKIHFQVVDRLFNDITITLIVLAIPLWAIAMHELPLDNVYRNFMVNFNVNESVIFITLINVVLCSVGLVLFLSLIKHLKNRTFIKHSLLYKLFTLLLKVIKSTANSGPFFIKTAILFIIFLITIVILTMIFVLAIDSDLMGFICFCALVFVALSGSFLFLSIIKALDSIMKGVDEIKNGNLDHKISINPKLFLLKLSADINSITDGLKKSLEKEVKAERMKAELITNVSHDLKTPLTSIINYADILAKEDLTEQSRDYVTIIQKKSAKLKKLTEDLFEISKAQSGNLAVKMEKIDVVTLIKQILGEFENQIANSKLTFKFAQQYNNFYVNGDGKKLSRAFENLILNCLKYSLPNTRVYIDIYENEKNVCVTLKNTANYEMDFKEDEIVERFVRGDQARSTEGNGLGLAIANSYVKACGGNMQIKVDGDLFKVIIEFARAKKIDLDKL